MERILCSLVVGASIIVSNKYANRIILIRSVKPIENSVVTTEFSWYDGTMEIRRTPSIMLLKEHFLDFPIVAIVGPRQCGKTTLARQFSKAWQTPVHWFDLENERDLDKLDDPFLALEELRGLVVIDEIQRRPNLFPILRVLVDKKEDVHFLILGSASRDLLAQSSETLAGRISYIELSGFTLPLIPAKQHKRLWLRGGFPLSFLARNDATSFTWRKEFVRTFLERDIPSFGFRIAPRAMRRFWTMITHYHGQYFNASEIGRSLGLADTTVKHHLDILSGTFMVRQLQPFFTNTKKRLIHRPKIYFRDSGLLHAILSLSSVEDLLNYPGLGASWEGFAIEQVIAHLALQEDEVFFWGTHGGAELDLVTERHGRLYGFEMKYAGSPKYTLSMKSAVEELNLSHLWVVHAGKETYALRKNVTALSIGDVPSLRIDTVHTT